MTAMKTKSLFLSWATSLLNSVRGLSEWWLQEALNLLPKKFVERYLHQDHKVLTLAIDDDVVLLRLLGSGRNLVETRRVNIADYSHHIIGQFLGSQGLQRKDVDVGLELPLESIFCRKLSLPSEASSSINEIVTQTLLKKTPFKLQDIYCDHVAVKETAGDKITVWQWIARRKFVHDALLPLQIGPDTVDYIFAYSNAAGDGPPPVIKLRPRPQTPKSLIQQSICALGGCAVLLALVAGGLNYRRQQTVIDNLESQISATKIKAEQVRALVNQLEKKQNVLVHLRLYKSGAPGLIDLWNETTRILPSHTWVTEFRLSEAKDKQEQQVAIAGFSAAAPSLVGVVDSSPLFLDAVLTAPVSLDSVEGRERFALQAKVRQSDSIKQVLR
jgi:general secretion pathway protein L